MSTTQASAKPEATAQAPTALLALLEREPYRFDFFQAVRLLGLHASTRSAAKGRRHPVGGDERPDREIVRFRALVSHAFPSSEIVQLDVSHDPPEMVVSFLGMTGPSGVLPQHYTRTLIDRVRQKDFALRDFLDLFHHRVISYFYRAWEKHNFAVSYETALRNRRSDPYSQGLSSLIGQGTAGLQDLLQVDDEAFIFYAGQFARFPRAAISLERMVQELFELPAQILQFQGQWLALSPGDQTSMPSLAYRDGRNNRLGVSAIAGERVWSIESKFRVRLGPLSFEQFRSLTPMGDCLLPLAQFVRRYVGPDLDFDVQPVLRREEVPPCRLGGDAPVAPRLGWTTWILTGPPPADADDAVFVNDGGPVR